MNGFNNQEAQKAAWLAVQAATASAQASLARQQAEQGADAASFLGFGQQPGAAGGAAFPGFPPLVEEMGAEVRAALDVDKERIRKAVLKNMDYLRRKELGEVEKKKSSFHISKRAKLINSCGMTTMTGSDTPVVNTSVYITGMPKDVSPLELGKEQLQLTTPAISKTRRAARPP
jgi:hypothetical protein